MKRHAPATARNADPILAVLRRYLPATARILEVASGTGEHGLHFTSRVPGWIWQPTDLDSGARASINGWREEGEGERLLEPVALDATRPFADALGSDASFDAVVCINMIHISPVESMAGLVNGAADVVQPGGHLVTYGPYRVDGAHTAPSNEAFDADLRARDPSWGVRDLETLVALAHESGFRQLDTVPMPANNFTVVFEKL